MSQGCLVQLTYVLDKKSPQARCQMKKISACHASHRPILFCALSALIIKEGWMHGEKKYIHHSYLPSSQSCIDNAIAYVIT